MNKKMPDNSGEPEKALKIFDSLLQNEGQKKLSENQIFVILDALANASDCEIVARFPSVLAICARRDLPLKFQALFSRYGATDPKRLNLEKLLLASAAIFNLQGIKPPGNLVEVTAPLKFKYGDLLKTGEFQLSDGMHISVQNLQHFLESYAADRLTSRNRPYPSKSPPASSRRLDIYLNRLFSPKQKELVLKRRDGQRFTKTEREYFSRVVRKKLEAIADEDVVGLARNLTESKGEHAGGLPMRN